MQERVRGLSYHILCVITGCGGGDWPPLLALAAGLHRRGHHLLVVCDRSTVEAVQSSGLPALCLPPTLGLANVFEPAISLLLSREKKSFQGGENPLIVWGQSCVEYIKKYLKDWRPSLVITSLFGIGLGEILSEEFSTPRCFLNPAFYFGYSDKHFWDRDFSEKGGQMYRQWLLPLAETANLVLHATDPCFDISPTLPAPQHEYVGPLFWEKPGNLPELLKEPGPPWVLITLSTSPQPGDLTIARTALKSLGSMDVRVLVTLASGHNKDELGQIPANVHVMGYLPHSRVLPLCCLVISHAGHGIVLKAMTYGVPMVLVPWGRDQPGVAARAKRLGTAMVISRRDYCVESLADTIKMVLINPEYLARSQIQSCRLKSLVGEAKAVGFIERFMETR